MNNYRNYDESTHKNEAIEEGIDNEEFERIMVDLFVDYREVLKISADR